ncbi:MAG: ATP-binding protein [Magnetococcales bacterium]|nr:ATP-binding protein [Magnetococcales bacterium]
MLKELILENIGPAPAMELPFGKRINLLTGDNGLGKTFLLDIAWWALTQSWPAEVNRKLSSGMMAKPDDNSDARSGIKFSLSGKDELVEWDYYFDRKNQKWTGRYRLVEKDQQWSEGHLAPYPGLVIYAQADGGLAIWDSQRNLPDWRDLFFGNNNPHNRPPAFVFSPDEIWNGLQDSTGKRLCNGLIADWAGWQKEQGVTIRALENILTTLSPSQDELLRLGQLTRISLSDVRDIPTLRMPYGQEVPVLHASSGIRRILSLCYLLVWAWQEHSLACKLLGTPKATQLVFLIDEIEAHLHPKWQRSILRSLLEMAKLIGTWLPDAQVQFIIATHSPLILASMEPFFDSTMDKWFDIDLLSFHDSPPRVQLTEQVFLRRGDASNWLTSNAFDLKSGGLSLEAEQALEEASALLNGGQVDIAQVREVEQKLFSVLSDTDPFWIRWRYLLEKKGLQP